MARGTEVTGSKAIRGIQTTNATASDMVKETEGSKTMGFSRTCSNGESGENKHGNGMLLSKGRICSMQPVIIYVRTNILLFLLSIFLDFIFLFF